MTVRDLLDRCDSRELAEWEAYASIEPFGEERADLRAGIVAAAVANSNPYRGKAWKPSDFMPKFEAQEPRRQSPQEMQSAMRQIDAIHRRVSGI